MIYYGFLLFLLLEYVRPGSVIPGLNALRLNTIVPLAVIAGTFLSSSGTPAGEVLKATNTKTILFLLSLIVFSVLLADVTLYSWIIFTQVFGYVLVYWVIARQITDVRRIKGVFSMLVVIHLILAALTPQMFTDPDARHYMSSGTFLGDGNDYALSVNVALPFCLFLLLDARSKFSKTLYAAVLLVLVLCVVATKSRGGTLALGAVGFYYWLKSDRKFLMSVLVAIAFAGILMAAPASYWERMGTISAHQDGSSQGRLTAWRAGTMMALDHPVFGVGAGHFPTSFGTTYKPKGEQMPWLTAHSIYFLILGELGFPGIGALLFLFGSNLAANRRVLKQLDGKDSAEARRAAQLLASLSASLVAYAVGGAFLSAAYYPHMFVLAGLMEAGRRAALTALQGAAVAQPKPAPGLTYHWAMRPRLAPSGPARRQISNT